MAHYKHGEVIELKAASAVGYGVAVMGDITTKEQAFPAGSVGAIQLGLSIASTPTYGYSLAVVRSGVAKAVAAASLGAFAPVGPGSTNGALGPVIATGAAASGTGARTYVSGMALEAAVAGQYFAVLLDPQQLV
jgi:hypothetical protein